MTRFLARKTARLVALLIFVSLATFTLIELSPIDPINAYLNVADTVSAAQKAEISAYFGLDQSPIQRYTQWMGNLLQGDLGTSLLYRVPVLDVIALKFGNSLALMLSAFVLSGVMGLGIGLAMGQNKTADKILRPLCLTLSSTPTFFIGMVFLIVFAVKLDWFPLAFSVPIGTLSENVSFGETVYHLVLPVVALSFASFSHLALHTREKVVEILQSDYVLLAQTRGFTQSQIMRRHVLRNVLLPFVTLQFASLSEIFGGSILAETVFSYPGLGSVMVEAGLGGDVPLLLGVTLFSCLFVFVGNFTANVLYGLIDPKIRVGAKG